MPTSKVHLSGDVRVGALRHFPKLVLLCLALLGCFRQAQAVDAPPLVVRLPSARPSGIAVNDVVWVQFYAARVSHAGPAPAVVLVHSLMLLANY